MRQPSAKRPFVLLDGATGTELARRGVLVDRPGWTAAAIREAPDTLAAVHRDYVAAGADVITANTFRTHAANTAPLGDDAAALTREAVAIARQAAGGARVFGSIAPLADCYDAAAVPSDNALREQHTQHADTLSAAGVDGMLIETMTTIREAVIAAGAAVAVGSRPWVSVAIRPDGRLYSGESLADAIAAAEDAGASHVLANCFPASIGSQLANVFAAQATVPWGLFANTGLLDETGRWRDDGNTSPEAYAAHVAGWLTAGATVVGGCCGTTPEHIRAIASQVAH